MAKTIKLIFDGYFNEKTLPTKGHKSSGIYTVYAGTVHSPTECEFRELLYIGGADDVIGFLSKSQKGTAFKEWKGHLSSGEILIFSIADVDAANRETALAALIYYHYNNRKLKLPCNKQHKSTFDYPPISILTCNQNKFLKNQFIVVD